VQPTRRTPVMQNTDAGRQALTVVPGASCYAVCGWLELLAAD